MWNKIFDKAASQIQGGALYITATPIGNLADITLHALAVLQRADCICAEDTRVGRKLLSAYGISGGRLISVREHNEQQMVATVLDALGAGKVVAQISDAGTPAVCDPGARLAAAVRAAGFPVVPVAGASAVMAALSVAGIVQPEFCFIGFLPAKRNERQQRLHEWQHSGHALVCFESPHRITETLADMAALLPDRTLILGREISKTFETFLSGSPADILATVSADPNQTRGEMVLVLHPAAQSRPDNNTEPPTEAQRLMRLLCRELPKKNAAALTAEITGIPKKALYDWIIRTDTDNPVQAT